MHSASKIKFPFLNGGNELSELTRSFEWEKTSLGPVSSWPQTLKATVGIILHSDFPMFLWWGDEMIQFYNDAYRPSLGNNGKHPAALGQKAEDCWPEIWPTIFPLIRQVKLTGKSFFAEDQLIPIYRNGELEDVYWTFSYSAVIGEEGTIDGVLVVCNETTRKVQAYKDIERSQKKASQNESNLKNVILQSPVAMAILKGPQHRVEIANEKMFRLWGKEQDDFLNKPIFDVLVEARNEGFEDLLNQVFTTGKTFTAYGAPVTLYRNEKQELVYVHFVYEAFQEADGSISGVMVVAVEVTEEINIRKRLEESQKRFRALVESAPFPIGVYTGREMRIELLNQAIIDVWGKGSDLIGKTYAEVLPELKNDKFYAQLDNVFSTGQPFHARHVPVSIMVDGKLKTSYFNYSYTPLFDADNKVYGVMNTAADVTDLNIAKLKVEQSESNFRRMVNQAPVAMCILLGPEFIVTVANQKILELWGKREEEVMFKPLFEGLPDAKDQGLEKLITDVYQTGKAFYTSERPVILLRHGRYDTIYQNFVYEPYLDSDGTILGVLAITIDVTEQVVARLRIEEVVRERTESLRKSNEELSQFAYVASHDLQEPVRKIGVFVEMLYKSLGEIDDRSKNYLHKIDTSADRMLTMIRDILSHSQISNRAANFEPIDLNKVLENVRMEFELLIEEQGGIVESNDLPSIEAIGVQMNQLFGNLISNALKFSIPGNKVHIKILAEKLEDEEHLTYPDLKSSGTYYKISFIDNGIGFSQEYATHIFEIFSRLHDKTQYKGTGIGLATCRKIAQNHGGTVEARSTPGHGATFMVILPAHQ